MINSKMNAQNANAFHYTLNNGHKIPAFGLLGTFWGKDLENVVKKGIDVGYRLIDTAFIYNNKEVIGRGLKAALQENKVTREELFIISKFQCGVISSEKMDRLKSNFDIWDFVLAPDDFEKMRSLNRNLRCITYPMTEFACVSRGCIEKSNLCNGVKDCEDGSDETISACRNLKCPNKSFFWCDYGACVRATSKCDGRIDCADKSDETNSECTSKQSSTSSVVLRRCRPNNEWRCKTSKECILKSTKCNGRNDCKDGSDEDIQDCEGKPSATTTTIKPKPTPVERPTNNTCNIPYHPDSNSIVLTDREDNWLNISLTDSKAPKLSKIEIFCNPNYALENGETFQRSVCQQKGQWHPALRPCQKSCPTLRKDNTDITCYRNGSRVDCNSGMVWGTSVRPVCKPLYHSETEIQRELTCLETGKWDGNVSKCVPDCGIPNIPPETLVYAGTPINASDSPWHVAIYKLSPVSKEINKLICGGTLISANMVLSAAHCFFYEGRNTVLNSSSDYEVVVGKYTRDYIKIDNSYQKTYKIRDIIFTEQGYNPDLTSQHSNDIVVLVLNTSVEISTFVLPACVDWATDNFRSAEGTPGKLVGWSENQIKGVGSEKLLYAELPFISYRKCIGKVNQLDSDKFCAGSETGAGARKGDSGGGLVFRDANTKVKYYLRGIVSTRDANSENSYATFTDISKHIDWLEEVRVKVTTELSGNQKSPVSVCNVQHSPDKRIKVFDKNNKWLSISSGLKAPEFSTIEITCNPTYTLPNGSTFQRSVCVKEEKWTPSLEPCLKSCPTLKGNNTDITCYRNGKRVDCNKEMVSGTGVRPVCKPSYYSEMEIQDELTCLETGKWDGSMPMCVPDCGILNNQLETLIFSGTPIIAGGPPWHVAIFKLTTDTGQLLNKPLLICGGTLISVNMVLSAAHCFYHEGQGKVLNSSSNYEVVVGKYTSDYAKIDNTFQRVYKIRDIIFTEQGYNPTFTDQYTNDIVVLVLKTPVEISKYVLPACIDWSANDFQLAEGTPGKLVGWGEYKIKNKPSDELLYFELPFISHVQCIKKFKDFEPDKFCAGSETSGARARRGDSGGGLVFRNASTNKENYYVRGIVSTHNQDSHNIVAFTDISKYIKWLAMVRAKVTTKFSEN